MIALLPRRISQYCSLLLRPAEKFLSVFCCHDELTCHKMVHLIDFGANYNKSKLLCIFLLHCNNFWSRLEPFLNPRVNASALEPFGTISFGIVPFGYHVHRVLSTFVISETDIEFDVLLNTLGNLQCLKADLQPS